MNAPGPGVAEADVTEAQPADRRQAEYFRRVLHKRYIELGDNIAKNQLLVIRHQNRSESAEARRKRRMLRDAERERHTVRRLIDALEARFGALGGGAGTGVPLVTVSPR